ncbi:MAG: hypothetical protein JW699_06185 [Chitinispirillaceae bacterium]|nr:hypothetical protein [Chitinispirillaceae bacterium]
MRCARFFLSAAAMITLCYSWEARQQGLVLGGGIGAGGDLIGQRTTVLGTTYGASPRCNPALLTDLKIGYSLDGLLEISIVSRNDWQMPYSTPIVNNTNGIEFRYFLKPVSPSKSFGGGIGYGFWFYPFDRDMNRHYGGWGYSLFCGAGYEIRKNLGLQLDIGYSMPVHTSHVSHTWISGTGSPQTETVEVVQINHTVSLRLCVYYSLYI